MKPIIATTLANLFVADKPWRDAHKFWFYKMSHDLNDESYFKWIDREDYFDGIEVAMDELMPHASETEKIVEARRRYFESVIEGIKKGVESKEGLKEIIMDLKKDFRIALITTNDNCHVKEILTLLGLEEVFDIIEASLEGEKDNSNLVFQRFIDKYGKPDIYLGTSKRSLEFCEKKEIKSTYINFYDLEELDYDTIYDLEGLKEVTSKNQISQKVGSHGEV